MKDDDTACRVSAEVLDSALDEMSTLLAADGYDLSVHVTDGRVHLDVRALPAACPDCLVPKELFASMALSVLASADIEIAASDLHLTYPGDKEVGP